MIPLRDNIRSSSYPYVRDLIILSNVLVYFYAIFSGGTPGYQLFIYKFGLIPAEFFGEIREPIINSIPPYLNIFTSMFVHAGFWHLFSNMLFLYIFGDNVEDVLGHLPFLFFYIFSGVAAALSHIIVEGAVPVPMVGASGAVAGVLGAYFLLFPYARVETLIIFFIFIQIISIPAVVFIGLWFLIQIFNAPFGGNVAWFAHIGGFLAGFLWVKLFVKRPRIIYY